MADGEKVAFFAATTLGGAHTLPISAGSLASSLEIKARWAYSELTSTRFGSFYRRHPLDGIERMADAGVDFDALDRRQWGVLVNALDKVRGGFSAGVDLHDSYMLLHWTKGQLCQANVLALLDPRRGARLPYFDFLHQDPRTNEKGEIDPIDPRTQARTISPGSAAPPLWGGIVVQDFPGVLIDGYLRSILFMRDADRDARLPMWVGLGSSAWRVQADLGKVAGS